MEGYTQKMRCMGLVRIDLKEWVRRGRRWAANKLFQGTIPTGSGSKMRRAHMESRLTSQCEGIVERRRSTI